ncbi:MAG: phosphatidate cytidylyltransferase [Anaerolineae bacterium]
MRDRLLSAAVLLPVVGACAWLGSPWFTLFVVLALGLGARELANMGVLAGHQVVPWISLAIAAAFAVERGVSGGSLLGAVLALSLLGTTVWYVIHFRSPTRTESWAITLAGGVYVGFLGSHLIALRLLEGGLAWLTLAVVTMWISDTGAYAVGRLLGRHKMAPVLSPKKTWEGAAGGLVTALIFGVLIAGLVGIAPIHGLAVGGLIGVICPFGDLAISMIKRQVGVKDTGNLIPGHGGVLDRLDTLLFIAPLAYYYATLAAGIATAGG